jgi:hypothetical protein
MVSGIYSITAQYLKIKSDQPPDNSPSYNIVFIRNYTLCRCPSKIGKRLFFVVAADTYEAIVSARSTYCSTVRFRRRAFVAEVAFD